MVLDGDRAIVAGGGLAGLDLASGRVLFTDRSGAEVTAAPVPLPLSAMLLTAEADGALRCRDRASGIPIWTLRTSRPLLAPPLVDRSPEVLYLGTTEKRILQVKLARRSASAGAGRWERTWPTRACSLRDKVLFASYDAVLYALRRNGNLAWRASLPSRPLSGPLVAGEYLIVACLENELVVIAPETGEKVGSLRTSAEIRTPPLVRRRPRGDRAARPLRRRLPAARARPRPDAAPPTPTRPAAGCAPRRRPID